MVTGPVLQIVVPMAGRGSRFADNGFTLPKPLIDVAGEPMIVRVVANLTPSRPHRFVFIVQGEHCRTHALDDLLIRAAPGSVVVQIDGVTEGAACTVLRAAHVLDEDAPLMIANCDQWIDTDVDAYLAAGDASGGAGVIMTMPADDPKWSYVGIDDAGEVTHVVEKQVVSPHATVGVYNFRRAGDFVAGAEAMIADGDRVNGEFYVAPVYNRIIAAGGRVARVDVGDAMWGLGVPEDLEHFLSAGPLQATGRSAG